MFTGNENHNKRNRDVNNNIMNNNNKLIKSRTIEQLIDAKQHDQTESDLSEDELVAVFSPMKVRQSKEKNATSSLSISINDKVSKFIISSSL